MSTSYVASNYCITDICRMAEEGTLSSKAHVDAIRDLTFLHCAHMMVFADWYKNTVLHKVNVNSIITEFNNIECVGNYEYGFYPYKDCKDIRIIVSKPEKCRKKKTLSIMCPVDLSGCNYKDGDRFCIDEILNEKYGLVTKENIKFISAIHNAYSRLRECTKDKYFELYDASKEIVVIIKPENMTEAQLIEVVLDIMQFIKMAYK